MKSEYEQLSEDLHYADIYLSEVEAEAANEVALVGDSWAGSSQDIAKARAHLDELGAKVEVAKAKEIARLKVSLEEAYEALSMHDTEDGARGVRQAIAEIEADLESIDPKPDPPVYVPAGPNDIPF